MVEISDTVEYSTVVEYSTYKTVENAIFGYFGQKYMQRSGICVPLLPLGFGKTLQCTFLENHVDRPIFGRISVKTHNSKKSKIMKIHHFLKSHPECLWGQELVSRPSLTPNLPIFKRKNSSQKELIPYIISEILTFFDFYEIHVGCKSFHLWVNCRNFYPKISSLKSLERVDAFYTINRKFLTITTKLA